MPFSSQQRTALHKSAELTLVMMAGHPGAGKSTLALAIGRELGWPVLDKDTLKTTLLKAHMQVCSADLNALAYELLYAIGWDLLVQQRLSVIFDTPGTSETVDKTTALARTADVPLKVILCLADNVVRNQRLATRAARISQRTVHVAGPEHDHRFQSLPADTLVLHTDRSLDDLVSEALGFIYKK